jgi:hypothetical protein
MVLIKAEGKPLPKPGTYVAKIESIDLVTVIKYEHRLKRDSVYDEYKTQRETNENLYWEEYMQTVDPELTEKKIKVNFSILKDADTRKNAATVAGGEFSPLEFRTFLETYPNHRTFKNGKNLSPLGEILEAGGMKRESILESVEVETDTVLGEVVKIQIDTKTSQRGNEYVFVKKGGVAAYNGDAKEVAAWIAEGEELKERGSEEEVKEETGEVKEVEDMPFDTA